MYNVKAIDEEIKVNKEIPGKHGRTVKPGDVLGQNYRLTALLGKGGMGFVFSCRHEVFQKDYALKILHPAKVNENTWQRFQVEGRAIAKLDHPNIVKIFNMGVDGQDCPFYVMELLDGDSLEVLIEREGTLSQELSLEILRQLATGLGYEHRKGIIQREVKPSNVILQKDPGGKYKAKIVDFGLAKLVDKQSRTEQGLTGDGDVFGSPFYMSPEQTTSEHVDERSDIYSLGCTLYKSLTGRPPFTGENAFQTMFWHQTREAPSLAEGASGQIFPQALEDFVKKTLAKKPEHRYQSMDQLLHDLSRLTEGKTLAKTGMSQGTQEGLAFDFQRLSQGKNPLFIAAFLLVVIGISVAAFYTINKPGPPPGTAGNVILPKDTPIKETLRQPMFLFTEKAHLADPAEEKAKKCFQAFVPKASKAYKKDNRDFLEMYFPTQPIGVITPANLSVVKAGGTVNLQVSRPIVLSIERTAYRFTWDFPWILKKISKTDFNEVVFSEQGYSVLLPGVAGVKSAEDSPVLEMLQILREWKNLKGLQFCEYTPSAKVLQLVDSFPQIDRLEFRNTELNGSDLLPYKFIHRVRRLNLIALKDIDSLIYGLRGSENLEHLAIEQSTPSNGALASLNKCPNLKELSLEKAEVSDAQLLVMSKLNQLEVLLLRESHIPPEQLLRVKGLQRVQRIVATNYNWSVKDLDAIKRELPNVETVEPQSKYRMDIDKETE